MTGPALSLVLIAALLHASWNALVKGSGDRAVSIAAVSAVHVIVGIWLTIQFPLPDPAAWPYLIASTIIHYGYYVFLVIAYGKGDLSQVYPISRGVAPMLVTLGGVLWAGDTIGATGWGAIVLISLAIAVLAWPKRTEAISPGLVSAALLTGLLIASYSVVDGIGVRLSGQTLSYIGWLFLLEAPVVVTVAVLRRRSAIADFRRVVIFGLAGGALSSAAYGLVLFAKTIAPLGAVSAVRESSVIIAALIGAVVFGERPWKPRIGAAVLVVAGVVILSAYS